MEFIRGLINIKPQHKGCVATIGNFDGVHLGHQTLLKELIRVSKQQNLPTLVILFEPQPNEYFLHGHVPPRLMRLREKLQALQIAGIDRVLCLHFNQHLAAMTANEFVEQLLVAMLGIKELIIGDDFRFGARRAGDVKLLQQYGATLGFNVIQMSSFMSGEERVSSTRIRHALQEGDLIAAQSLLGRPFSMSGRVAHGDKRGRLLGFPTANIYLHRKVVPLRGVYAIRAYGITPQPIAGVANVGNRPTIDGVSSLLEVHLFEFNENIYGKHITIEFEQKIRDEQRYASLDLLKQQIMLDVVQAKLILAS